MLKRIIGLFVILSLITLGCINPQTNTPSPTPTQRNCQTVYDSVPSVSLTCNNVSYTESVCGIKKLSYTTRLSAPISLCIESSYCAGRPLENCSPCTKAMTRCIMTLKNTESLLSGEWSVAANFSLQTTGFSKEPIRKTIRPNESFDFDFYQIYNPGLESSVAVCSIGVMEEPQTNDCHQETRQRTECQNVTTYRNVSREVCS
ncbi:MAG: hypothetical protein ACP5N9_05765 [Candidatus Bilamarchaeum sp.]